MGSQFIDANSHILKAGGTELTGGAVGVVTAGTISGTTAAGAAPTVAIPTNYSCNDTRGTFVLTPVTGGGAQAAGDVCTVRFAKEYSHIPGAVIVQAYDDDTTDLQRAVCATSVTAQGFNINVPAVLVTAHAYRISYAVIS